MLGKIFVGQNNIKNEENKNQKQVMRTSDGSLLQKPWKRENKQKQNKYVFLSAKPTNKPTNEKQPTVYSANEKSKQIAPVSKLHCLISQYLYYRASTSVC